MRVAGRMELLGFVVDYEKFYSIGRIGRSYGVAMGF